MKKIVLVLIVIGLLARAVSAQFGTGIVFDPTNYANALLRYYLLEQHLVELKNSYAELVSQYSLALQMAKSIENMSARYRALFSAWRDTSAADVYGNTAGWVDGINSGVVSIVDPGYQQATTALLPYASAELLEMNPEEVSRVQSQYATVELADGANQTAMAAIGAIRSSASNIQTQIGNLEQDSFSNDPNLNTEVSVLNKINAAGVLTLRSLQDSNKLLASLLEEQTILAKQQREATANTINADIERQAGIASNMAPLSGTLTNSLASFRMP